MQNCLLTNPIRVHIVDENERNLHTFIFVGNVPNDVVGVLKSLNDGASLSAAGTRTLRNYYGNKMSDLLMLDVHGGRDELDDDLDIRIGDVDIDDSTGTIDINDTPVKTKEARSVVAKKSTLSKRPAPIVDISETQSKITFSLDGSRTYVTDVFVYPEDKISELRDKIYLATDIPAYRQHLYWYEQQRFILPYKLTADGIVDIVPMHELDATNNILGIPVDKMLYHQRNEITVETTEPFTVVANTHTSDFYIIDANMLIADKKVQFGAIIADTYKFELFYYGFIIKYYPIMSPEVFHDYITNEHELYNKYPDLARNKGVVRRIFNQEHLIISKMYAMSNRLAQQPITVSITNMAATTSGSATSTINIRNLFDRLTVSPCHPQITAYVEKDSRKYILMKKHVKNQSIIGTPAMFKSGLILVISIRKQDQENFHAKTSVSTIENEQSRYIYLNVLPNGKYIIKTLWSEEEGHDFKSVLKIMKKFTDDIIEHINNMNRDIFITGHGLQPLTHNTFMIKSLSVSVFWKKTVPIDVFNKIRASYDPYIRANIISSKGTQQQEVYEFTFRKGMTEFDPAVIERVLSMSHLEKMRNHYVRLTSGVLKQKWNQLYDGRTVRMIHRTTDIKFEISNIKEQEFNIFISYIRGFVYNASMDLRSSMHANASGVAKKAPQHGVNVKKLRKLRETDPELYNLKKHGSNKVYSILCQNPRQPLVYTDDELSGMSRAERSTLIKYYNFTLGKPAYYRCSSGKYSHLSFIVGVHPKNYCLPCCGKSFASDDSKKKQINTTCMSSYVFGDNKSSDVVSHHIMNYGKSIVSGRLSRLPTSSIQSMLANTIDDTAFVNTITPPDYYIYGVDQDITVGSLVDNISIIYSVAAALSLTPQQLIDKLLLYNPIVEKSFSTLLGGGLFETFGTYNKFITYMKYVFSIDRLSAQDMSTITGTLALPVAKETAPVPTKPTAATVATSATVPTTTTKSKNTATKNRESITPTPIIFRRYNELFMELAMYADIYLFVFDDPDGKGESLDILISDDLMQIIKQQSAEHVRMKPANATYLILIKKQAQYHPMFVVDVDSFFKTGEIIKKIYNHNDKIIEYIRSIIISKCRDDTTNISIAMDTIKEFVNVTPKYQIKSKYINRRNLVYAMLLYVGADAVYVPIDYSANISDGIEPIFDAFNRHNTSVSYTTLMNFISDINGYLGARATVDVPSKWQITPTSYLKYKDKLIGFQSHGLIFYHNEIDESEVKVRSIGMHTPADLISLSYDPDEVNSAIARNEPPAKDPRESLVATGLYTNYIYDLYVLEFVNAMEQERNDKLRSQILENFGKIGPRRHVEQFQQQLKDLLDGYPADFASIVQLLGEFHYGNIDAKTFTDTFNATIYEFDKITLHRLKKMQRAELVKALQKISTQFAVERDITKTIDKFPNIYMPCATTSEQYCSKNKLIVNDIELMAELLAEDILNPLKSEYMFNGLFSENIINYFSFESRPNEVISMTAV